MVERISKGLFVTGTDTGVGKTVITCALARHLVRQGVSVGVMKPVETGIGGVPEEESDARRLAFAASSHDAKEVINPYRFSTPLAPSAAASDEGMAIDMERIVRASDQLHHGHAYLLVEGVGGVLVPMGPTWDVRDLIVRLGLPVLVVGRAILGGVNHGLLTVESLRARGLRVVALLLNQAHPQDTNLEGARQSHSTISLLRERSGESVLGPLRYEAELHTSWSKGIETLSGDPVITELGSLMMKGQPGTFERPDRREGPSRQQK